MEDVKSILLGVLGNIVSHIIIRTFEERAARRKGTAKHMRQG